MCSLFGTDFHTTKWNAGDTSTVGR